MSHFIIKGDKIKLIPTPDWSFVGSDEYILDNGTDFLQVDGNPVILENHILDLNIIKNYQTKSHPTPGKSHITLSIIAGLSETCSVNKKKCVLTEIHGSFSTNVLLPAVGNSPDPIVKKSGTWNISQSTQSKFSEIAKVEIPQSKGNKTSPTNDKQSKHHISSTEKTIPIHEQNWIELEYLYCDDTGVAGARYSVINNENGCIVAQGKLDKKGFIRCDLPLAVNNVSYRFDNDPPTIAYLKEPISNPELAKVKEDWFDRMAANIADSGIWVWGVIQGDFNENPTTGQIIANSFITLIPYVDQIGDLRDLSANLKPLIWDKCYDNISVWTNLVLTLIGCYPSLGSAIKGVLKVVAKPGRKISLKLLIKVLNKFHKGNAVQWLRKLLKNLPKLITELKQKLRSILKELWEKIKLLADILPTQFKKNANDLLKSIKKILDISDKEIDEIFKNLKCGLKNSIKDLTINEFKGLVKKKSTLKQTDEESPAL